MKRTLRATLRCRATYSPDLMGKDGEKYQGALHELVIAAPILLPTPLSGPGLRFKSMTK